MEMQFQFKPAAAVAEGSAALRLWRHWQQYGAT